VSIEESLRQTTQKGLSELFGVEQEISLQKTRREFEGDYTINVFPFLKYSAKSPEITASLLGDYIVDKNKDIDRYNVVKGFLNVVVNTQSWLDALKEKLQHDELIQLTESPETILVEYSSPNTNKPLHLGHLRNIFLGDSVANMLSALGHRVIRTQIINDRGIHICKSMVAWSKYGHGKTPESTGKKGDHFVGDFYVKFDQEWNKQTRELEEIEGDLAAEEAPLMKEAREALIKWEQGDQSVKRLWSQMNSWVYSGFDQTYNLLGVHFDKLYYESDTYQTGRDLVLKGVENGAFERDPDNSVWADLTKDGLDRKILLRSDGTAVYMTQDVGTAFQRYQDFPKLKRVIYTVGNEQDYHFKVLFRLLDLLGFSWASSCYHLSYGMVELPDGKMKSREGTVVDADELVAEVIEKASIESDTRGYNFEITQDEKEDLHRMIGLGALKYFILKVDSRKKMLFDPAASVDLHGNTAPFIQYTHARIQSIIRRAEAEGIDYTDDLGSNLEPAEQDLLVHIMDYSNVFRDAAESYSPSNLANYIYDLVKLYNTFYQSLPIFQAKNKIESRRRVAISTLTGKIVKHGMGTLGIEVPDKM
jgi:arginyl-tRNA synthetase